MTFSAENLEKRRQFLTPNFYEGLRSEVQPVDPFTLTADPPKAFRAGECRVKEPNQLVVFEVLLFWKTDTRTEQRPIIVETRNAEGKWLINSVSWVANF